MSKKQMSEEQHQHFHQLIFLLERFAEPKYEQGAIEHGGNIWDLSDEQLEAEELNEMIDLIVYRLTRILKKRMNSGAGADKNSA
jgi:hypothetical protein